MRARLIVAAGSIAAVAAFGVALAACGDLFHGTDDILNLCEIDGGVEGCGVDAALAESGGDAAPDASFELCLTDSALARKRAETACKWVGACETPIGRNRFAECMVGALQTYDCAIAPNRRPKGAALTYWACLTQVDSCTRVDKCVFPMGHNLCPDGGVFAICDPNKSPGVRVYCNGSNIFRGEACFATGRSCLQPPGPEGFCLGDSTGGTCTPGCSGTQLHDCDDAGVNVGIDCNAYGAQVCVASGGAIGCKAELGRSCQATTAVTCSGFVATGCPSGVEETIACLKLTGLSYCETSAPGALWDVSRVCFDNISAQPCGAVPDSCSGNTMSSCLGGAKYTTTCDGPFTGCATTPPTIDGANAHCTLPADAGR